MDSIHEREFYELTYGLFKAVASSYNKYKGTTVNKEEILELDSDTVHTIIKLYKDINIINRLFYFLFIEKEERRF